MQEIAQLPPPRTNATGASPDCCSNCVFFLPGGPAGGIDPNNLKAPARGICRRYPPAAQVIGMQPNPMDPKAPPQAQIGRALVPVIGPEWCGEHTRVQ